VLPTPYIQTSTFPQDHSDDRTTGCGGEMFVRATFKQALGITGSVRLLLKGNDENGRMRELLVK
jgi:hypothetical protein